MIDGVHVASASYEKAKASAEASKAKDASGVLKELQEKFSDLNIRMGAPGASTGIKNVAIASNILEEMARDPEARIKYESLLHDIQDVASNSRTDLPGGGRIYYAEYFITGNGELRIKGSSKTVSPGSDNTGGAGLFDTPKSNLHDAKSNLVSTLLQPGKKDSWMEEIMKAIDEKKAKEKEEAKAEAKRAAAKEARETEQIGHLDVRA
jgi:hypothetical protein